MLIGYIDEMQDGDVACLAEWADYHAKLVPNPSWKRAYALIREGSDLLLRRRAMIKEDEQVVKDEKMSKSLFHSPMITPQERGLRKIYQNPSISVG